MLVRHLLLLLASCAVLTAAQPTPPNIVFIISDDHAWTDYGFMGHKQIATPHLDKLAARSALFSRGYVPTALCRPALATFATGLYAHQHKISGNDPTPLAENSARGGKAGKAARPPDESAEYQRLREQLIGTSTGIPRSRNSSAPRATSATSPANGGKAATSAAASPTA